MKNFKFLRKNTSHNPKLPIRYKIPPINKNGAGNYMICNMSIFQQISEILNRDDRRV